MKEQTTTDLKMKYDIDHMISAVGETCQDLISNKTLILGVLATSGFIQVVLETASFQLEFVAGNVGIYILVCVLGLIKHSMDKEINDKEFTQKSIVNFAVTGSIIGFFYTVAIIFNVLNRIADTVILTNPISGKSAAYFIYTGYVLAFTHNLLKAKVLLDYVAPKAVPGWATRPFTNFRKNGKMGDILKDDEKPES